MNEISDSANVPVAQRWDPDNDPEGIPRERFEAPDPLLDNLITVLVGWKDSDSNFGITLALDGLVVYGDAVPRGRWNKLFIEQLRPSAEVVADALELIFDNDM